MIGDTEEKTGAVRRDGKGKHTTTYSTLIALPESESYIIDTPGIKSISTTKKINESLFEEIIDLSRNCKFRDCQHKTEPNCAVKRAVENDEISIVQLERYHKYLIE